MQQIDNNTPKQYRFNWFIPTKGSITTKTHYYQYTRRAIWITLDHWGMHVFGGSGDWYWAQFIDFSFVFMGILKIFGGLHQHGIYHLFFRLALAKELRAGVYIGRI